MTINQEGEISVQRRVASRGKWAKILLWLGILILFAYSFHTIMDLGELANPYGQKILVRIIQVLVRPNIVEADTNRLVAAETWETIQIGFLATTIGGVFAIPLAYLGARISSLWGRRLYALIQPILYVIRAVHPVIVVLLATVVAGIGPAAGVLALTPFTFAVLTREFSEFTGQNSSLRWSKLLALYLPGIAIKRLSVSVLIATVLGFFGGGGIGFFLRQSFFTLAYRDAGVAILACIIAVGSLDLIGDMVWHRILDQRKSHPSIAEVVDPEQEAA